MKNSLLILALSLSLSLSATAVEFSDILNDPDNIELNEQFAKQRIIKGDLSAALSAVERVLIQVPMNVPFRLLRAELLINLGNDSLAHNELVGLKKLPTSSDQKLMINRLLLSIKDRASLSKNKISIGFGVVGSNNTNTYPSAGLLEFVAGEVSSTNTYNSYGGQDFQVSDRAGQTTLSFTNEYDLANQNNDVLISSVSARLLSGSKADYLDSMSTSINLGLSANRFGINWMPRVSYSKIKADNSASLTMKSFHLNGYAPINNRASANFKLEKTFLDYTNDTNFTNATQNDGQLKNIALGFNYALQSNLIASINHSQGKFDPDSSQFNTDSLAYFSSIANERETKSTTRALVYRLTKGSRIQLSHTKSIAKHKNKDPTSLKIQDDSKSIKSITFVQSGREVSELLKNWQFSMNVRRSINDSNIMQFDYKRNDWSLFATYFINL